jgi:RHS repeat-associated protein
VSPVIADQVGAPVLVEGPRGEPLWNARIAPFGAADIAPESRIELGLRFPGHYADPEIGLHCNRFRHYNPTLGRYLQSDPWGVYGGTNLYSYRTNPLLAVDVRGLGEEGDHSKKKPPADEEGAGPKKQPGGEQEGGKKQLKDMTPEELKAHVQQRAEELKQVFQKASPGGEEHTTLSVGVVEKAGDPETRRVVVSTSNDKQQLHSDVRDNMRAHGETPIQGEPYFIRTENTEFDKTQPPGPDNRKTRVEEVDMNKPPIDGDPQTTPYTKAKRGDPPEGTQHHAEQRMETGAAENGEHVLAQQPTKDCCPGCAKVLGDNGRISKIPNPGRNVE